ncbi:MAG: cbb3-type cytochrome c oxidase subunit 3 [Gammaproteobacteria bacterium]|jgi:cytochrome c oxidase cbb3-type subunit 4
MDINTFRGIMTALLMILFLALVVWAYSSKRRRDFEEAAKLPLGDDELPPVENKESN